MPGLPKWTRLDHDVTSPKISLQVLSYREPQILATPSTPRADCHSDESQLTSPDLPKGGAFYDHNE
jgi:hypothetical protein